MIEIKDNEKPIGFIGFDDCQRERINITEEEIDEIRTICQVLATFLIKQRCVESMQGMLTTLLGVMEGVGNAAYIVDRDSHAVLHGNKQAQALANGKLAGARCYELCKGSNEPCDQCPMKGLSDSTKQCSVDVHNDKTGKGYKAFATSVEWQGCRNACLVNCTDM